MNEKDFLFEISYEVCNKVGGIYTVLSSKAKYATSNFSNYFAIGPYLNGTQKDFVESSLPKKYFLAKENLEKLGIKIHFGYWNIEGKPKVILVDYLGHKSNINDIKTKIWQAHGIDSLGSYWYDFDEVFLWSWCCGIVIENLTKNDSGEVLIHSHEWMSGGAIFYFKNMVNESKYKTIFTTHATILGRTICGTGGDLYSDLENIDSHKLSYELKVHTKHQCETILANISNCFTTVSDITGEEAKYLFSKAPDVLLYNGFDNYDFNDVEKMRIFYLHSRNKIDNFLEKYFKNYYNFDLDNTQIFYTSGRNEFHNKGVDMYIKSLGILNEKLKKNQNNKTINNKTIVNLFLIPIGNFDVDRRFFENNNYVGGDNAPLSTHHVENNNEIIRAFKENNLLNNKDDRVKVILMPFYLDGSDGIINMNYYEVIRGLDLGIFPSFYEPWGYTPLESIAYGVPTITTNLSGFGRAIFKNYKENNLCVSIIRREGVKFDVTTNELAEIMNSFVEFNQKNLLVQKENAIEFSKNFSWEKFYDNYLKAYEIAKNS